MLVIRLAITTEQGSGATTHSPEQYQPYSRTTKQLMTQRPTKRFFDKIVFPFLESFFQFTSWEQASGSNTNGARFNAFGRRRKSLDFFIVSVVFCSSSNENGMDTNIGGTTG
jgi:hypothetical protein